MKEEKKTSKKTQKTKAPEKKAPEEKVEEPKELVMDMSTFLDASDDMTEVMGLEPAIFQEGMDEETLKKAILESAKLITPTDVLREETVIVLTHLGWKMKGEKKAAKKEKKPSAGKAAPAEKKDSFENPSATTFVLMKVVENPDTNVAAIAKELENAGLSCSNSTITTVLNDIRKVMTYLKRIGKIA